MNSALRAFGRWSSTRPTPGRGVETLMYSYVAVEYWCRRGSANLPKFVAQGRSRDASIVEAYELSCSKFEEDCPAGVNVKLFKPRAVEINANKKVWRLPRSSIPGYHAPQISNGPLTGPLNPWRRRHAAGGTISEESPEQLTITSFHTHAIRPLQLHLQHQAEFQPRIGAAPANVSYVSTKRHLLPRAVLDDGCARTRHALCGRVRAVDPLSDGQSHGH